MVITGYENLKNLAVSQVISFVFGARYSAFVVSKKLSFDSCLQKWVKAEEVCKKMDMFTIH